MAKNNRYAPLTDPDVEMTDERAGIRRISLSGSEDPEEMDDAREQDLQGGHPASESADEEMDPGAPFAAAISCSHSDFYRELDGSLLPKDAGRQECFDNRFSCELGDPGAKYTNPNTLAYATTGQQGGPMWQQLFSFLLSVGDCLPLFNTVYLLVDNRDLTAVVTQEESLAHWPSVAMWWKRRLALQGPGGEKCDILFVPIAERSGLHLVHPTWAGTFVLSAATFLFPQINFVLLDSDCLPITLFEVGDLWKEARIGIIEQQQENRPSQGQSEENAPKAPRSSSPTRDPLTVGQGVLLVTEHNAEINAGFIVVFASNHVSPMSRTQWAELRRTRITDDIQRAEVLAEESAKLARVYWENVEALLATAVPAANMTEEECGYWVQSGLALTPFAGCRTRHSVDWTICWSLVGEWTCCELFPPPKGAWPRNGHPEKLLHSFAERLPPILTWAHSSFEQGSLPSMLHLPGEAVMMVLPGDKMFQAQSVVPKRCRPAILHGYGGGKHAMPTSLARLASEGWAPLATAMVGNAQRTPAWQGEDLRPVVGTSIDCKLSPEPLSPKEEQLLLTMWKRIPANQLPDHCAITTWLAEKTDLPAQADPGGGDSPHLVCPEKVTPLLDELICWNIVKKKSDEGLTENQQLALRILAYTMTTEQLRSLVGLLLGDDSAQWFPHAKWIAIVGELFAGCPLLRASSQRYLADLFRLLPQDVEHLMASTATGLLIAAREVLSLQPEECPEYYPIEIVAPLHGQVGRGLPEKLLVDCTGLGGHDLGGPFPWHLCVRTDKFGQGIYGPSIAPIEVMISHPHKWPKCLVALGLTKAMHEFLVLHYFATDSANSWDELLVKHLKTGTWCSADMRRKEALVMFDKCHVAPSHRRLPHKMWVETISLYLDLLFGRGKQRYLGAAVKPPEKVHIYVRGFSAGSYSGLCLLHLLWKFDHIEASGKLGGIAVPPTLLQTIPASRRLFLHLIHYKPDQMCCWTPSKEVLDRVGCEYTLVDNDIHSLKEHYGKEEHSYGHWINIHLGTGVFELWQLLEKFPDAAHPRKRDLAPLRLISWLSCKLRPEVDGLIQEVMQEFAQLEPVQSDRILQIGEYHLGKPAGSLTTWDAMRDAIIEEITLNGLPNPADVVLQLITLFLQRLPLPRLVHFIDLVLPQMVPSDSPSQRNCGEAMCSLLLRNQQRALSRGEECPERRVGFGKLFESHSGICHVSMAVGDVPLLLFANSEDEALPPVHEFKDAKSVRTAKQNVVLGLKKGYTILLHFHSSDVSYHAVLYLINSTPGGRGGVDQHKLWKHVVPRSLEFAWLPENLANAFCANALEKGPLRRYAMPNTFMPRGVQSSWVTVDQIYWIGECKSSHELEVFVNVPIERLRVGCGLQCTLPLHPLGPASRPKLFAAAVNLLKFAMSCHILEGRSEVEVALGKALRQVLWQTDEHVLAAISALVLALLEGRTDLPISGVFGAGKTRAAAIMVAGLLAFDPSLRILILTKENIAAKAFADHLVSLKMPQGFNEKIGRLVGYMELRKNTANKTPLDLPAERRIDALWGKQILIGCGGGYQQECTQSFSPVAGWVGSTDLTLTDESQQYGNLEETATVARTPRTCLHIWMGDHRQTPGGLKKTEEAFRFRQKLQTRPLALRCGTEYVQPHELQKVISPYLDGPAGSPSHSFRELLQSSAPKDEEAHWEVLTTLWHQLCCNSYPWLDTPVCVSAFAILWMAVRGDGISDPTATTLRAAAGLHGRQHWGLILSSSARVTQLTYETVIGVRYPELVKWNNGQWQFGRFTPGEALPKGGFLPILWDVPKSNLCAVEDVGALVEWVWNNNLFDPGAGQEMAVLHNQNNMVRQFGMSAWVAQSKQKVYSRSVTSCAGMTAYLVVVAQTRVGFLSGGRGQKFRDLHPDEQASQIEEAYARATVALTRAQAQTILFGPLDMKGLMGAVTVVGSLACGLGHCWQGQVQMHWRQQSLAGCAADADFLTQLRRHAATVNGPYPPLALLECIYDGQECTYKIRRLHLMIVDLWRPWQINKVQVRSVTHCLRYLQPGPNALVTTPMEHSGGTPQLHERRFIYGYGLDGSDFPCYLVWPERVELGNSIALLDSQTNWWCDLATVDYLCPLDLHHMFDAFRISAESTSAELRSIAIHKMGLLEEEISADCLVTMDAARRKGWPVHEEQPVDLVAPEADVRNVPVDVISVGESEVDNAFTATGSSHDGSSDSSSCSSSSTTTEEPARSEVSIDHEKMSQAYDLTQNAFPVHGGVLQGGMASLNIMDLYPVQWPLAKLKIPIEPFVQRLERLVTGYVNEIAATQWYPATFNRALRSTVKLLTEQAAIYLAKEVASLLRPVASHPLMKQFDPDTKPLLSSEFWVMPIYRELLFSGSRHAKDRSAELKRPAPSLVKIVCQAEAEDANDDHVDNTFPERVGTRELFCVASPIQYMNIWFPAHWSPVVMEAIQSKNDAFRQENRQWFPGAASSQSRPNDRRNRELRFTLGMIDPAEQTMPTLTGRLKADWLHLPFDDVLTLFPTVKEGICRGVFRQKAAAAWFRSRAAKVQLTVLIPGRLSLDDWLEQLGTMSHAWPQPHTLRSLQVTPVTARAFHLARKYATAKHLWPGLRPQWWLINDHLRLKEPGTSNYEQIHAKFFANPGQPAPTHDAVYQGWHRWQVWQQFQWNQMFMQQMVTASQPWGFGSWQANLAVYAATLRHERKEIQDGEEARKAVHQYRTPHGTYRVKQTKS